jgi:hypothetical protein
MLSIETTSKHSPEEAIKRAVKFFGPQGTPKGKGSTVSFDSREWDYQVKEFIGKIK